MREVGLSFTVERPDVDESFPSSMSPTVVARYLSEKKAEVFRKRRDELVVTADTIVVLGERILNKPVDRDDAIAMLRQLSGQTHRVITAVSALLNNVLTTFEEHTFVTFRELPEDGIAHYVDHFKPFDKAGAYGAQECLPHGLNPCSDDEIAFLSSINKLALINSSIPSESDGFVAIERISGSYFNVMGLPIHKVYNHLKSFA